MESLFKYPTGNPHADEIARRAGKIIVEKPEAGDWVCQFSVAGEPVALVTAMTDSYSRVSRYLNRRKVDFTQDFFEYSE